MRYIVNYMSFNEAVNPLEIEANKSAALKDLCALIPSIIKKYSISKNKIAFFRNFGSFVNLEVIDGDYTYFCKSNSKTYKSETGKTLDKCLRKLWIYTVNKNLKSLTKQKIDINKYIGKNLSIKEIIDLEGISLIDYETINKEIYWLNENLNKLNLSLTCHRKQGKANITIHSSAKVDNMVNTYVKEKFKTNFFKILDKGLEMAIGDESVKTPKSDSSSIGFKIVANNKEEAISKVLSTLSDNIKLHIIIPPTFSNNYSVVSDPIITVIKLCISSMDVNKKNIIDEDLYKNMDLIADNDLLVNKVFNDLSNSSDYMKSFSLIKTHAPKLYQKLIGLSNKEDIENSTSMGDMGFAD